MEKLKSIFTKIKILSKNFFSRISSKIVSNKKVLLLLLLVVGFIIQPVFAGSGIIFNLTIIILSYFSFLLVIDESLKGRERTIGITILVFVAVTIMSIVYQRPCKETIQEYSFIDNVPEKSLPLLEWNLAVKKKYNKRESCAKIYSFIVFTSEGEFQVKHECTAYIKDRETWQIFDLDESRLYAFIEQDAKKKIIQLLKQSCTQDLLTASKVFIYKDGVCSSSQVVSKQAKIQ